MIRVWIVQCSEDTGGYVLHVYDNEKDAWSTNIGAVVGRVFTWHKHHLQVFGGAYYNSEEDDDVIAGEWTVKFNVSFLLPK